MPSSKSTPEPKGSGFDELPAPERMALIVANEAEAIMARRSGLDRATVYERWLAPLLRAGAPDGHAILAQVAQNEEQVLLYPLQAVFALSSQAIRACRGGNEQLAWQHLCDANRWLGGCRMLIFALAHESARPEVISVRVRAAMAQAWRAELRMWAAGKLDQYESKKQLAEDAKLAKIVPDNVTQKTVQHALRELFPDWNPRLK